MRYSKSQTLTVSEDDSSIPKMIRFQELQQSVVDTSFKEMKTGDIDLPANVTFEIPMGAIGQAKWLYLYTSKNFKIKIDDGPEYDLEGSRPNEMWITFNKIEIKTSDVTRVTYAIAGE